MNKHTKNWKVDFGDLSIGNQIVVRAETLGPDHASLTEKRANVRLAAAAPELLEYLKQATDQFKLEYTPTPLDGHAALIRKFEALIKKAEGGAE